MESLGDADTLEAQSKAILMENDIRDEEFTSEVNKSSMNFFLLSLYKFYRIQVIQCLPLEQDRWSIPQEEFSNRLDLREKCIFTIDPATARDLDDALSCERLEDGIFNFIHHFPTETTAHSSRTLSNRCAYR